MNDLSVVKRVIGTFGKTRSLVDYLIFNGNLEKSHSNLLGNYAIQTIVDEENKTKLLDIINAVRDFMVLLEEEFEYQNTKRYKSPKVYPNYNIIPPPDMDLNFSKTKIELNTPRKDFMLTTRSEGEVARKKSKEAKEAEESGQKKEILPVIYHVTHTPRKDLLTPREKEILGLIAEGYTNPQIAKKIFLSGFTIDTHRKNLLAKLGVNNTASLIRLAVERKLI